MTEAVKRTVTIAIRRPSKTPAVFVAACFTEPAWEPVELTPQLLSSKDAPTTEDSSTQVEEYEFSKKFELPEGKYQYKFRLGTDEDSWFCDNDVETVVNDDGICNNVLVVNDTSSTSATEGSQQTNGTPNGTKLKEPAKEEDDTEEKAKIMEDIPVDAAVVDKSDKEVPVNVVGETAPEVEKQTDNQVDSVGAPEASASKGNISEEKSDENLSKKEDTVPDSEKTVSVDTTEMEQEQSSSDKLENTMPESTSKELPEESKESESRAEVSQNNLEAKKELSEKFDAVEAIDPAETIKEESNDKVETPLVTESETTVEEPKNNTAEDLKTAPAAPENDVLQAEVAPEAPAIEPTEDSTKEDSLPEATKKDAVPAHAEEPVAEKANGSAKETANPVASMVVEEPTVIEPEAVSEEKSKEEPAAELEKTPVKAEEMAESISIPAVEKAAPSPEAIKEDTLATKEEPVSIEPENVELPQEEKVSDKNADLVATEDKIKEVSAAESEPVPDAVKADSEVAAVREAEASVEEPKEPIVSKDIASKEIASDDAPGPVSEKPAVANEEQEKSSNEPEAIPEKPKESAPELEPELTESKRDTDATENSTVDGLETQGDPVNTEPEVMPAAPDKVVSTEDSEVPSSKEPEPVIEAPENEAEASEEISTEKEDGTTENAKKEESPLSVPMPEEAKDGAEEKTEPVPAPVATNEVEDVTGVVDELSKEADTANEEPDKDASQPVEDLKSTEDDAPVVKEAETITDDKPVEESAPEVLKDNTKEESQEPAPGPNAEIAVAADEAPVNEHQDIASIEEVKDLSADDPAPADCNVPAVEDEAVISESKDTLEPEVNRDSQPIEKKEETEDIADPVPVSAPGAQPAAEEDPVKEVPSQKEDETKEASEVPVIANIAGVEALQNVKSQANPELSEEEAGQVAQSSTPAPEPQVEGETKASELKEPATEELAPVAEEPAAAIQKDSESGDSKEEDTSAPEKEVEAAGEQTNKPEEQKLAEPEATGDDAPIPAAAETENKEIDLPSKSIKDEAAATTQSSTSQVTDEPSDKPAPVASEGPGEPDVSQEPKEVHVETAVVEDASKEANAQSQVEDAAVDAPIDVPEEPKQDAEAVVNVEEAPKDVQNDVTATGEEVKSEAEKSLDHVVKVDDKRAEEAVEEAPVAVEETVEAESAPETVAADPVADETPAPEPEAAEEEAHKTETADVTTIEEKDVLPEVAETPVVPEDTEKENVTVEAEKPEIPTSEAVTTLPGSLEAPKDTEETPGNPDKCAATEPVTHNIEENTTVPENVPEPTGTGSASEGTTNNPAESVADNEPEVPTNKDKVTKEAILDEQLVGSTSTEGKNDPKADLPNVSADSIQEAGLQGKLQSTEAKPDFVTDHAKVEEDQPKESSTSKTEGQEDAHKTNGATIAAALGAAAVVPGAAFLAKKAFESGETTDKKTAADDTPEGTESLISKKGTVDDSEHINNVMAKEDSKVGANDESSNGTKNGPMQEEPATAESTSKAHATEENDKGTTIENTSLPEQVKESPVGKDDAQETVNGKVIANEESKKATPETSASADIEPSSSSATALANASTAATTNGTKTNGTKTNGVSEETRPPTGNKSITSLTSQRRDNFLKYIWRAIFVNFFGSLFGFRRRDTTA
ncbi:PT repeat family protein [Trichophyton verrucosum HKI 0517]|uniref:PT repeat family protein n=1 Tax=Trichophyton verrucosum (strain HKI 0517) TaxID=663202 RepID=D4D6K7_TRIVH|nr:PT repeat family protein [Trichophyton verrucosum HKI 0517]EFE42536.1 PT repeat family protein [Trichophyton verrucosum HKI 0517]